MIMGRTKNKFQLAEESTVTHHKDFTGISAKFH